MKVVARAAPAALVLGAFLCADQVQVAAFSLSSSRSTSMARRKRIIDDSMKHGMSEAANKTTDTIVLNHLTDTSDMLSGERTALSKAAEKLSAVMANITSENEKEMKFASNDTQAKMQKVSSMLQNFTKTMEDGTKEVLTQLGDANKHLKDFSGGFQTGIQALEGESNKALTAVHMETKKVADQEEESANKQLLAAEAAVNALFGKEPPEPIVDTVMVSTPTDDDGGIKPGICGCHGEVCRGSLDDAVVSSLIPDGLTLATTEERCMKACEDSKCCTGYMLNEGFDPQASFPCVLFTGTIDGVYEPGDDGIAGNYADQNLHKGICYKMHKSIHDISCVPNFNDVSYVEVGDGLLSDVKGLCGCGEKIEEEEESTTPETGTADPILVAAGVKAKEGACQTWRAPCETIMSLSAQDEAECAQRCTDYTNPATQMTCTAYQFNSLATEPKSVNCDLYTGDVTGVAKARGDDEISLRCMVPDK